MGLADRILGRPSNPPKQEKQQAEAAATSTAAPHTEILHDPAPSTTGSSSYGPPSLSPGMINAGSLPAGLQMPSFPGAMPGSAVSTPSGRLYDPYEGISSAIGGKKQAFVLPEQPEFVFEEKALVRRKGIFEYLQFYSGMGYVTGGTIGVAAGAYKFLSTKSEVPGPETLRLKTNRALNSAGSFARPWGCGAGILGMYFACFESLLYDNLDQLPESVNSVLAGALTGALFRSPRGPRQAAAAAVVGSVGGLGMIGLRQVFPSL
mmetsp:Transcript_37003/g.82260  ORF Transcript_37003/g.82260 Transcript_37003/m.82260 type:complete len:263 (-) Transcript_37003:610-1398(-)|eukprot:CAMPEP_0202892750 /NCGR_PEP_ID=MMETSP1392-20130828/2446_1 /ASSEMBLY_ACC=CAM_ASM_000868 /TAXON_ID=225041 /ORGANISM="Chlamydomonas chlamydogama, Strain SAG 11-48b" /LENGTH=262 /DNA_ID=CAMNT_0049576821 /DNA_START=54 /DNA_END=842 /DNA_ORIENTATION=-